MSAGHRETNGSARDHRSVSRRRFLGMSAGAGALLVPGMGTLLAACSKSSSDGVDTAVPTGGPSNPVELPIYDGNPAIASDLSAESGPLKVYAFPDYLAPASLKSFEQQYGVDVEVSNFGNYEEALRKLASGDVQIDVYLPPQEQLGKLVAAKILQPLNNSYIPNRSNLWPELADPWYDKGGRYTVANALTTTGVGWRTDMITIDPAGFSNPWDMLWDPAAKGKVAIYDQFREAMAMAFYRNGGMDPNTSSQVEIDKAKDALLSLVTENDARFTLGAYIDIPEGKFAISHAFSGDMSGAQFFLPKGDSPSILRYVWPLSFTDGGVGGHVGTDNFTVVRGAQNPVLAHLFINHLASPEQAFEFYAWAAIQTPQQTMTADSLTAEGLLPADLASTIVQPAELAGAAWLQTLEPEVERRYLEAWSEVQRGA